MFNGYSISDIANYTDSALTYCDGGYQYDSLDTLVQKINRTFSGAVDTLSTSPLKLFGNVRLAEVHYLHTPIVKKSRRHYQQERFTVKAEDYMLDQNYPNPFNPVTMIRFTLPSEAIAEMKIYNILGQEVKTLFHNEQFDAGTFEVPFDGSPFASGVYFYRISFTATADGSHHSLGRKMLLLK